MEIREGTEKDIPQIIQVLKMSMGEEDLPLSEEIWRFKHVENPFGQSPVFVAEEDNKIVGVRVFMRWEWQRENDIYLAYRAVDTATHPDYQGKGIFKKLTLKAVEFGTVNKENFVFNTPNDKSRPGYLKMGWNVVGQLNVALQPALYSFWRGEKHLVYEQDSKASVGETERLCVQWNEMLINKGGVFTPKSAKYLSWRYINNPLQRYQVLSTENFYLAGYVKKRGNLKELRISECIFVDKLVMKEIKDIIKGWSIKFGVHVISFSPELNYKETLALRGNIGPILTLRKLNLNNSDQTFFEKVGNWDYSLGDLELF